MFLAPAFIVGMLLAQELPPISRIHGRPPTRASEILAWFQAEMARGFDNRAPLRVAVLVTVMGFLTGLAAVGAESRLLRLAFDASLFDELGRTASLIDLEFRNLQSLQFILALTGLTAGILGGLVPALFLFALGLLYGGLTSVALHQGGVTQFLSFFLCAGLPGIGVVILSCAAGIGIGYSAVAPGRASRREAVARAARDGVPLLLWIPVLLVIRGLALRMFG
jgi:uncharacterized membrane protein SpoIIM required for sporulation